MCILDDIYLLLCDVVLILLTLVPPDIVSIMFLHIYALVLAKSH